MIDDRFNLFTNMISSIYRTIYNVEEKEALKYGLKPTQISTLYNIYKFEAVTQVELIEICRENKAAISRTLASLIEKNLVFESGDGKYKKKYSLTDQGKEMAQIVNDRITNYLMVASGNIPEDKRADMYKCLAIIDRNLKEHIND